VGAVLATDQRACRARRRLVALDARDAPPVDLDVAMETTQQRNGGDEADGGEKRRAMRRSGTHGPS
jgi:hypothetical protein